MEEEKKSDKRKEYFSPQEIKKSLLLCIFLLIIGFSSIIFALSISAHSPLFAIFLTIGITFLISLTTVIVEYILRRENIKLIESFFGRLEKSSKEMIDKFKERIEEKTSVTEEKMDRIDSKLGLSGKLIVAGIVDIFPDRWDYENVYHDKIRKYLSEYAEQIRRDKNTEKEIWIMGIALRHFFQNETYVDELAKLGELGVKFKVLLLDPESEAAKERSKIESPEVYELEYLGGLTDEQRVNYNLFLNTAMFRDLSGAHEYIVNRHKPWIEKFDIRYYKNDPSYYLIKFPDKLIVENYHYGSVKVCDTPSIKSNIPNPFIGGRIPIFVYDSKCITYRLISNHFEQFWHRYDITPEGKRSYFNNFSMVRAAQLEMRREIASS
jgi:hypothetical protein